MTLLGAQTPRAPRPSWFVPVLVALAAAGVAVGAAGAFVQALWPPVGGLALALAGAVALFLAGRTLARSRAGALVPAIGWIAPVLYFANGRAEGDFVLANGFAPYAFLFLGAMAGVAAATVPVAARDGGSAGGA